MFQIKDKIYWVGIKDWELRRFHGDEYSTHRGSTYNSYLIKDQKIALVDTVWTPFHMEYVEELDKKYGLKNIELIVIQHCEQDHAGSLAYLMDKIPNIPIYCTKKGSEMIRKHFHKDWNLIPVKTGDSVDLGEMKLIFIEAPMLHWPDTMMTYVQGANVLLSNDPFGQHFASPHFYNDQVDQGELYQEALKYYANIITPFNKLVKGKIKELKSLNLPIDIIAPSHGIIWRDNPMQIVEKYDQWASNYHEGSVVILYDTMWGATKRMALAIAKGLEEAGIPTRVLNIAKSDKNDLITEVFKAQGVIIGSSTVNNGILSSGAAILEMIKGLKFKGKIGAAFGSYGWSGEGVKIIEEWMKESGIKIVQDGKRVAYEPTADEILECEEFGRDFSIKLNTNE
ncbi:anaerobic nitric oxide reductase flavorubredoxin [Desulforamulus aquiferis]|uniref:Anaerobic nitric oxide reductase flavorubredoxin n=1 Tax=Desulforamulus aquiferis TaxID=1397668 RepID=A0AAW7ZJ31_9FIRM|nr:anaerobic nitric oxide reductase flavorubredoxin [Desulforamulus aquiferis]MDO7789112.1 anaerobic nitric oxide reductase flavorubredoxin [Desulforamulus aquiferis]